MSTVDEDIPGDLKIGGDGMSKKTFEDWWKSQNGRIIVGDPNQPDEVKELIWAEFVKDVFVKSWMYCGDIGLVIKETHPLFDNILELLEKHKDEQKDQSQ